MLDPERQRVVGAAALVLAEDPTYQGDLKRLIAEEIVPASRHGKIAFFLSFDRVPVGFVTWAHLSPETEERMLATLDPWLHISEWNEGGSLWLRWLHLPKGQRREGLTLCLSQLFPESLSLRTLLWRKGVLSAVELDREVVMRFATLTR
jgi:hemolysin-activating ACP:hemolysin acyltransferase